MTRHCKPGDSILITDPPRGWMRPYAERRTQEGPHAERTWLRHWVEMFLLCVCVAGWAWLSEAEPRAVNPYVVAHTGCR